MESLWGQQMNTIRYQPLKRNITTQAVVIGGGMAGILTAYMLKKKGVQTILLEANKIGRGITKNTTAKITIQHDLIYDKLINKIGKEKAWQYAKANQLALEEYAALVNERKIACDFERLPAYLYSRSHTEDLETEAKAAQSLGISAELTGKTTLPFAVTGALRFDNQAQFHPLLFLYDIAKDLDIYEDTMVRAVEDNIVITDRGKVQAEHIVVATHFPFINVPGYYFARMHQERSYLLALKGAERLDGMYLDIDPIGYTLRSFRDYLLFGGEGHRTGKLEKPGCYDRLKKAAEAFYPQSRVEYCWSAQDCVSLDDIPYIGQYSTSTPNLYVATGFKKWGMTGSMVSAMILSDLITETPNETAEVFSPKRFHLTASTKNLLLDSLQTITGLAKRGMAPPSESLSDIKPGQAKIIEYDGRRTGAYRDENGEIFTVLAHCVHLGCSLEWNPEELSWDCPCHGSRYTYKGDLIDNPATKGLNTEKP